MKTKIMGILNITTDSFSDGDQYFGDEAAIKKAKQLISDGVDIIDIGAESTRPGAIPIDLQEEFRRLQSLPEIIRIAHKNDVLVSLDSYRAEVLEHGIDVGIDIINDQKGLDDNKKIGIVARSGKQVIIMHHLTVPSDRDIVLPEDADVIAILKDWIKRKSNELHMIKPENIIFDPGLGFGKSFHQSFLILKNIDKLMSDGIKVCVGHSRKGFVRSLFDDGCERKDEYVPDLSVAISMFLAQKGIDIIRVHDARIHKKLMDKLFY